MVEFFRPTLSFAVTLERVKTNSTPAFPFRAAMYYNILTKIRWHSKKLQNDGELKLQKPSKECDIASHL